MQQDASRKVLMLMPMAVAAAVLAAVTTPNVSEGPGVADARNAQHALYTRCRAQGITAQAQAPAAQAGPRTQSPAWLQQREAELTRCLQAGLANVHQSASAR